MKDHYTNCMFINNKNQKTTGVPINNIDTIRGCPNNCESCYANKLSSITIRDFTKPILVEKFTGRVHEDLTYRIGNFGDPAINWAHTEKMIKKYKIKNFFVVTKLQSIKGFSGYCKNLQVSVDPMNELHLIRTLQNVETLLNNFDVNIVLRIRSSDTNNFLINLFQYEAVLFANNHNLPVLETRVRFKDKKAYDKYDLIAESYEWTRSFLRPKNNLRFLHDVEQHYVCDEAGNKCAGCLNCLKLLEPAVSTVTLHQGSQRAIINSAA